MADYTYPNSQQATAAQQAQYVVQALQGSGYTNQQIQNLANAFAQIGGAEGGGRSGVVLNTAYPGNNYTPPAAGDSPEYSIGFWGMNLYDQGNYNLMAQALGQPQVQGQPTAQQAFELGNLAAANPEAQAQAAVHLFQEVGSFQPWTDPVAAGITTQQVLGTSAPNGWMPSGAAKGGNTPTPGTQTNVPGSQGSAPATSSPASVTQGTVSTITGTGAAIPQLPNGATWAQTEAYIRKNYPTYAWLLNIKGPDSPATVIQQAVENGWDATQLQAHISQTNWWKNTSTAVQQWQQNTATHPGEYDFNTKGSTAQQTLGQIEDAAKSVGQQLPEGIAKNLATEAMMYGWNATQIKENIGQVISSGAGQAFSTSYLSGVEANPAQYAINGKTGTGPQAAQAITTVRNAIAGQGYNPADFTNEDVDNLAQEYMKYGWSAQQLAAAVIKVGAGGTSYQLSPTYTQGVITNPQQYEINGKNGTGTTAAQALTSVRQAIAAAGKTVGGKGGITEQQVQELAQESMMFGWNSQQLSQNINTLAKGGGLLSPSYLQGILTNAQEYQPGGQQYIQAQTAVETALAQQGKTGLTTQAKNALIEAYMQQGWQQDPNKLMLAIGQTKGAGSVSPGYLTGMQANPQQYQPGGITFKAAEAAVKAAVASAGKTISPSVEQALVQQFMQQGWTQGSPQLEQAIGVAAGGAGYTQAYLTGIESNPQQYQPGGTQYVQAENDVLNAVRSAGVHNLPQDDLNRLVEGVMQQGWDSATLNNEIGALAHRGSTTAYNPGYLTGLAANPQEYQFTNPGQNNGVQTTADQVLTQVEVVAGNQGVNLRPAQAQQIAIKAMESGGDNPPDSLIQSLIQPYIQVTPAQQPTQQQPESANAAQSGLTPGTASALTQPATNNAPGLAAQLNQQAAQYLMTVSPQTLQQWERNIAGGTQTMQQFDAYLQQQAEMKYPDMAALIRQGVTPSQQADSLQQLAASTLEVDPTQVNFITNPTYAKMLDGGQNGGMMSYSEAGQYLRSLPQFAYTTNAHSDAANVETAILQAFGRVG